MDPTSIAFLFKMPELGKAVAGYLGLIESIDKKIDKLLQSDFNAGVRCLQEILVSRKEKEFLLKEAWRRFHTALTHETGERKALTYLGLALCQDRLGEKALAISTLRELSHLEYVAKGERFARKVGAFSLAYITSSLWSSWLVFRGAKSLFLGKGLSEMVEDQVKIFSLYENKWMKISSEESVRKIKQAAHELVDDKW